jgi:5-methylcytosine-specific restriction endonuclease McrA
MGFFDALQKTVNSFAGDAYRKIYFSRYPEQFQNCKSCGKTLDRENPREMTIDHIVPQKCGGTNVITNLQVLCQPCNSRKKDIINNLSVKYSGQALLRELKRILNY